MAKPWGDPPIRISSVLASEPVRLTESPLTVNGLRVEWEIIEVTDSGETDDGGRSMVATCVVVLPGDEMRLTEVPMTFTPEQVARFHDRYGA